MQQAKEIEECMKIRDLVPDKCFIELELLF